MAKDTIKVHMTTEKGRGMCSPRIPHYEKQKFASDVSKVTCKRCLSILYMKTLGNPQ